MVKRILKIVGIIIASFVVIAGGAVGISALAGGFNEEVIHISKIYFGEDSTNTDITVYTLEDVVSTINFEPANATEKDLIITVNGNDNGIIESLPNTLSAGTPFTVKVNKDTKGNNIGGVVTINAKSSNGLAVVQMRVIVDVNIPDNSLYFTGDNAGKISASGKSFTMPISDSTQYVYLKSGLVNAFSLEAGDTNLKSADISYTYYRTNGQVYHSDNLSQQLQVESVFNTQEGRTNYYYKIPITTDIAGTIEITARMHRTHEIQTEYELAGFDNLVTTIESALASDSNTAKTNASVLLGKYNEFLNKYIKYFDTTQESYDFFKTHIPAGKIAFTLNNLADIKQSLNYVFVTCKATINVSDIKLKDFTSLSSPVDKFNVFDEKLYALTGSDDANIISTFGLNITTDNETAGGVEQEKTYLYESLSVKPYLYVDKANIGSDNQIVMVNDKETLTWADRTYSFIPVYGFNEHTPITDYSNGSELTGYLLLLTDSDEYISISEVNVNSVKHWKLSCNTPLPNDQQGASGIYKALYLGFEITGISEENTQVTKSSFTRIYINYEDYDFSSNEISNLAFKDVYPNMTINDNLANVDTDTTKLITQDISLNTTSEYIDNMDSVSYTSVMYFAEKTSNEVDGGSKVATIGQYKFVNFKNANNASAEASYYMFNNSELIGERIPTYTTKQLQDASGNPLKDANGNYQYIKQYYLHALNASPLDENGKLKPVKIFAVVYLSDNNGNPIDINGRKIVIDETDQSLDSIPELVVIRITDFEDGKMPEITINSYAEEINYYTESLVDGYEIDGVTFNQGYINRNAITSYQNADGVEVEETTLEKIQNFLRIKLLKDNYFTLYVTPFELSSTGTVETEDNTTKELIFKDVNGVELTKAFVINSHNNRQLAFNNICRDFANYELYIGGTGVGVLSSETTIIGDGIDGLYSQEGNAIMIKYVLHYSPESTSSGVQNKIIYLDPDDSSIPYSTLLLPTSNQNTSDSKNNWTNYETHELEISKVDVDTEDMSTKLFARYAENASNGELSFTEPILQNGSLGNIKYTLGMENGNICYTTETNLITNVDGIEGYNLSIVDCSQAGTRTDIPDNVDESSYYYTEITDYINHYVVGENGTQITYTNVGGVMSFQESYIFDNFDKDGNPTDYIYFGNSTFAINKSDKTVNINGYVLDVVAVSAEEYHLTINQGEYFPIVSSNKALIYNEIFQIYELTDNSGKYIFEHKEKERRITVSTSASLILANGETIAYTPTTYLDDYSTASKNSAVKIYSDGDESYATINFTQGEELGSYQLDPNGTYQMIETVDNTGKGIKRTYQLITDENYVGDRYSIRAEYVQDNNGNLYFKEDSESGIYMLDNGEYRIITDAEYTGIRYSVATVTSASGVEPYQRYSKKGVDVYLLITFNLIMTSDGSSQYTVYKALKYELVQEEVEIKGVNYRESTDDGIVDNVNSSNNPLYVKSGATTNIYLNTASSATDARIVCKASDEPYFFNHVSFSLEPVGSDVTCTKDGNVLKLVVPSRASNESMIIKMEYQYKGKTIAKEFYIELVADVEFKPQDENIDKTINISDTEIRVYSITLNPNSQSVYSLSDIITDYFTVEYGAGELIEEITLSLDSQSYSGCSVIDGGTAIELQPSYAEYNGGTINKDYVLLNIQLKIKDVLSSNSSATRTITLEHKLYVEVTPTYVVDLTQLDENNSNQITIFNGEDIYASAIRLFDNSINLNTITDTNKILSKSSVDYSSIFTITAINNTDNTISISADGKITLNYVPAEYTDIKLSVTYPGLTSPKVFTITIRGVVLNYSPSGLFTDDNADPADKTTLSSNCTIELSDISTFDIDKYFSFTLYTDDDATNIPSTDASISIQPVLVLNDSIVEDSSVEYGVTYSIAYARFVNNELYVVESTGYTLTINQVSA